MNNKKNWYKGDNLEEMKEIELLEVTAGESRIVSVVKNVIDFIGDLIKFK